MAGYQDIMAWYPDILPWNMLFVQLIAVSQIYTYLKNLTKLTIDSLIFIPDILKFLMKEPMGLWLPEVGLKWVNDYGNTFPPNYWNLFHGKGLKR